MGSNRKQGLHASTTCLYYMAMNLQNLIVILDHIAPLRLAESWDNVGLLVGDASREVSRAMLTIDYTAEVAQEAKDGSIDLLIAYHPPIFDPLKRITQPLLLNAIRRDMAIYSPHTALDVAEGGTNDVLAEVLGLRHCRALRTIIPSPWHYKLVTFVPEEHLERLAQAMFDAGAGWIGNYSNCSFRSPGTGTFLGLAGSHPTVGQPGKLERAPEVRIETIVPASNLNAVCAALKANHPYEEPAFNLIQLASPPEGKGMGRIGTMPPTPRRRLVDRIAAELGVSHVLVAGPMEGDVTLAACCAGACGSMVDDAIGQKAELLLTGEMRHHDALKAAAAGMTVVCALHSNSERLTLAHLARRLSEQAPAVTFAVSHADRDPFVIV